MTPQQRAAAWIAAQIELAPPLTGAQRHTIRAALAMSQTAPTRVPRNAGPSLARHGPISASLRKTMAAGHSAKNQPAALAHHNTSTEGLKHA